MKSVRMPWCSECNVQSREGVKSDCQVAAHDTLKWYGVHATCEKVRRHVQCTMTRIVRG